MCWNFGTNPVFSSCHRLCACYMIGKTHSSNMHFLKLIFPHFLTSPSEIDQQNLLVRGFAYCCFAYLQNRHGNPHATQDKILHLFAFSLSSIGEIIIGHACPLVSLISYEHIILCRTEYWKSYSITSYTVNTTASDDRRNSLLWISDKRVGLKYFMNFDDLAIVWTQ